MSTLLDTFINHSQLVWKMNLKMLNNIHSTEDHWNLFKTIINTNSDPNIKSNGG